ncbi:hypothetical protein [Gemmatimonas sp.]|uniref:hypothetical protein n=1 Tax=Gemmatimonas sp. TaxID=1962908 RepID=UPI0035638CA7
MDIDNERNDGAYLRSTVATGRNAGREAWNWHDKIGEVHYAISRTGRVAGYTRFYAARFAPNGEVEEILETGPAAEAAMSIYSVYGGVRGFVERYYTLLKVPGDMYLTEMLDARGEFDGYHLASPDELDVASFSRWGNRRDTIKSIRLTTVPGSTGTDTEAVQPFSKELKPSQLLGRIWSPSKRWVDLPESALQALDTECQVLHDLTLSMKAQLRSRFALAGILFLPPGVSIATTSRGRGRVGGQLTEPTLDLLLAAMTKNVRTYDDATTLLPIILKGTSADDGEKIKHIILDRAIFETDLTLRKELIGRILQSLDSNQDSVQGTAIQSHWNAWSAADDERRVAVGPDIESLCWSLTRLVMQPALERARLQNRPVRDPGNIGIWFDLTRAATKSNPQEDARQAWDRVLIGDKPLRRMSGISETDKPDGDEKVRGVGRMVKNPMLMLYGTPEYDKIDWETVSKMPSEPGPAPDSPADTPESGPGQGQPGSPDETETDTPRTQRPV